MTFLTLLITLDILPAWSVEDDERGERQGTRRDTVARRRAYKGRAEVVTRSRRNLVGRRASRGAMHGRGDNVPDWGGSCQVQ